MAEQRDTVTEPPADGKATPFRKPELGTQPGVLAPSIGSESILSHETQSGPEIIGSSEPLAISTADDSPPVFGAGSPGQSSPGGGRGNKVRLGDRVFFGLSAGAGLFVIVLVMLVAIFLVEKAWPSIRADKSNFLFSRDWSTDVAGDLRFGIVDLLWTTVAVSFVAMIIATPIAIGIALFITHYAPKRLAKPIAYVIDLLAAIPSIICGIWGALILAPKLEPVQRALYHLSAIPFFGDKGFITGSIFDGGIVLAVMILPIITAISRDVFERTPRANIEAAWALGATKWEMIRLSVLPHGRAGIISGAMLGLGRALGETIAIALILSKPGTGSPFSWSVFNGGETFASKIANNAAEFSDAKSTGAYIAAGLVLFVLTFIVNALARMIVNRRKEFS